MTNNLEATFDWHPIDTIPKYNTTVYLKNLKGEIDTGEVYSYKDDDGNLREGINAKHGLGNDKNELGFSFWAPTTKGDE